MYSCVTKINLELCASVGFIEKEFVTMHGRKNIKKLYKSYRIVNLVVVV